MAAAAPHLTHCDLLIIGAGAGGLSTAITARIYGLDVVVIEKSPYFGGTTAFSGGVLWIPGNPHAKAAGHLDSRDAALRYLRGETGKFFDAAAICAFLDKGPEMVEFFERATQLRFISTLYPDYHPDADGGVDVGRSIMAAPYDIRHLGKDMSRLRPPLETLTFMGMMFNSSSADLTHFFNATRSLKSALYVTARLANHVKERLLYGRGVHVSGGNALAARLAKSALDLDIPILTSSRATELIVADHVVSGAVVRDNQGERRITASKGVVLACGGFSHDIERIRKIYPHLRRGGEHCSPVPTDNTGDGVRMAENVGAREPIRFDAPAAWMPTSKVPLGRGRVGAFPHLIDRYKPGIIGVDCTGNRFTNESNSYHDVGAALIEVCKDRPTTTMWLICDQAALDKYGLGYAKPAPIPVRPLLRKHYLSKGNTLAELAGTAGIDARGLETTVQRYNEDAVRGHDSQFGRGRTSFNRFLGDPRQHPNPCIAPIAKPPYYALRLFVGDLGTFDGIATDPLGRVIGTDGQFVSGLYAVGSDRASIMGGTYPGAGINLGPIMTLAYITGRHLAGL